MKTKIVHLASSPTHAPESYSYWWQVPPLLLYGTRIIAKTYCFLSPPVIRVGLTISPSAYLRQRPKRCCGQAYSCYCRFEYESVELCIFRVNNRTWFANFCKAWSCNGFDKHVAEPSRPTLKHLPRHDDGSQHAHRPTDQLISVDVKPYIHLRVLCFPRLKYQFLS